MAKQTDLSPVTVGIIGVGGLGRALSQTLCEPNSGYSRVRKLLLKGRDKKEDFVEQHIKNHLLPRAVQRRMHGMESLEVKCASSQEIAEQSNLVFVCLEEKYGESKGIPFWEDDFRKKLFNGNRESVFSYAEIFQRYASKAFVTFFTNPMLLAYFFQSIAKCELGQVVSFTADTPRILRALQDEITVIPHLEGAEAMVLGDHGQNAYVGFTVAKDAPSLPGIEDTVVAKVRQMAIEKGLDLARVFGSTTQELLPHVEQYITAMLANAGTQFVLGAQHNFPEGLLFSQVPLAVKEEKPGTFRAVVDDQRMAPYKNMPEYVNVRKRMLEEIALVSSNGMHFKVKQSRPVARTWYENVLKAYDINDQGEKPYELSCKDTPLSIAVLEDRIAVLTEKNILLWDLSARKVDEVKLDTVVGKGVVSLTPSRLLVAQELVDVKEPQSTFNYYCDGQKKGALSLPFIPTALFIGAKGFYFADQDDYIRVFDTKKFSECAKYERLPLEGDIWIDKLFEVPGSEEFLFGISTYNADRPKARVGCWKQGKLVFQKDALHGAFDAKRDRWGSVAVLTSQGSKVNLERLNDQGVLEPVDEFDTYYDVRSICFDNIDNYVYVGTKTHVVAVPYWKMELLKDKRRYVPIEEDVRDVRFVRSWA